MTFHIFMGLPEMEALWKELLDKSRRNKLSSNEREFFDKWSKALEYLSQNPKHPGLQTHEIDDLSRKFGVKVWQSYLENNTPGAGRIFWAYGPDRQQITILVVAMLTSKGASGVTGAGFITLAATLAVVDPRLVPGMAIVLGIDKFMSECRALTNLCGNGVACVVVSAWEGELDRDKLHTNLNKQIDPSDVETAVTTG